MPSPTHHLLIALALITTSATAHDRDSETPVTGYSAPGSAAHHTHAIPPSDAPLAQDSDFVTSVFAPFSPTVTTRFDQNYLYVESDGMPGHPMMIGITAWQQQVPLPQPYTGDNAWRFPLQPEPADNPLSAKSNFFRGAIALAANGVPIFNPIKNDGRTDTFLAGELDEFGGHAGRADDYHYHIAPTHLQAVLGPSLPIAYALDGYALYGYAEPDGSAVGDLDAFNGHHTPELGYHYHATKQYPYINGGFHGKITEHEGQVDPQPRASGPRPATRPLRGARITGFQRLAANKIKLTYELNHSEHHVAYTFLPDRSATFEFIAPDGSTTSQSFSPSTRRSNPEGDRQNRPRGDRESRPSRENSPPRSGANEAPREPWLKAHLAEIDANHDGQLTRAELADEIAKTFSGYDRDDNGSLAPAEYRSGPNVRSPLAGFVKEHAANIDQNQDDSISRAEFTANVMRMFDHMDADSDNTLSSLELHQPVRRGKSPKP